MRFRTTALDRSVLMQSAELQQRWQTRTGRQGRWWLRAFAVAAMIGVGAAGLAQAQPMSPDLEQAPGQAPGQAGSSAEADRDARRETVQIDVSTRSVAVTSGFSGTEIIVFGAVDNSRQPSAESGYYDVVIVVEGTPTTAVARKKSRMAGIWLNSSSITFESVPSYYAIVSTRPLDELADPLVLRENDIGFDFVRMKPVSGWQTGLTTADLEDFKSAVVRLKQREHLYVEQSVGVSFIGRSLFRASIRLPANVPVGELVARAHLFRDGRLLHTFRARVQLRREGVERWLYAFAFSLPLLYGLATVMLSIGAGLAATELFRRAGGR